MAWDDDQYLGYGDDDTAEDPRETCVCCGSLVWGEEAVTANDGKTWLCRPCAEDVSHDFH